MKLQKKPEPWLCLATSFAMAADLPVEEFLALIGHDGGDIAFPELPEPSNRRGHHPQECINVCLTRGYAVTPIELFPVSASTGECKLLPIILPGGLTQNWLNFIGHIQNSRGVITGVSRITSHAVAYDHGVIFDPDGSEFTYSRESCERRNFVTRCVWRIDNIVRAV